MEFLSFLRPMKNIITHPQRISVRSVCTSDDQGVSLASGDRCSTRLLPDVAGLPLRRLILTRIAAPVG
jgi:hypothetical protein